MLTLPFGSLDGSAFRVLCLGAHSDDIEIGCGGTVLALAERCRNLAVQWTVFSGNSARADEARESAMSFLSGVREVSVQVKSYRDGYFPFVGDQIKDEFESMKRSWSPDVVFTHYRNDRHQDHRLISDLAWNTFRDHLILEYEIPKYDGDLGQPNTFVPLSENICERKLSLLMQHFGTQRSKHWFDRETFQSLLRLRGMEANSPTRYAEAFYSRKTVLSC